MEVKLTFSAVKKDQFIGFANYLESNGGLAMTYVFVTRPSDAQIKVMLDWLKPYPNVDFQIAYLF